MPPSGHEAGTQNIRLHRPPEGSGLDTELKLDERFPGPWNAGAEHLYVKSLDGYVPPVLVQVDPDI